jgi:predicted GNAT family N-acyltransferase
MADVRIVELRTLAEREQAFAIRRAVFVQEQGVAEALEFDECDAQARHLLALRDGEPVGTLRMRWLDRGRTAKIERVAVLPAARGAKVGQALVEAALAAAKAWGAKVALLHAQTTVQGFYVQLGFVAFGPEFVEDGILHVAMRLPFRDAPAERGRLR